MKLLQLAALFSLSLVACAPVTQVVTSVLPGTFEIEETRPEQGSAACSKVEYLLRNGDRRSIRVEDRASYDFQPVDAVTLKAQARNGFIVFCTETTLATIPGRYETNARGTVNDVTLEGKWRFFVAGEFVDLVRFDLPSPAVVPLGGQLCFDAQLRSDERSAYAAVPASGIALRITSQGRLTGAVVAQVKPVCLTAPQDTVPGEYQVGVVGRVGGVGLNRTLRVTVK